MSRSRLVTSLAAAAFGIALLGACGGESLSESFIEQAIERGADGEVDFDFDGDGSFSIETDEGTVQFDADGDGGVVTFEGVDGESGQAVINKDGATIVTTEDGGSATFGGSVPDEWPEWLGAPRTADPSQSYYSIVGDDEFSIMTAQFTYDANEDFAGDVGQRVQGVGFTPVDDGQAAGGENYARYQRAEGETVTVIVNSPGVASLTYQSS